MTSETNTQSDLVILTADRDARFAIQGILARWKALGIRQIVDPLCVVHPQRDPGVFHNLDDGLLPAFARTHRHAMVIMDREGSGVEHLKSSVEMEETIEAALRAKGWGDRAAAIVIDPELEAWIWADSPHVAEVLGWQGRTPNLASWLEQKNWKTPDSPKPSRPKEALDAALYETKIPHSSSLFRKLAEKISLLRCTDRSFLKMRTTLQRWFEK